MTLARRLADHGFLSNADYDYPVRCLLGAPVEHLRCLNVEGETGRRKTAFANALAQALDYAHVLYHEFDDRPEAPEPVRIPRPPEEEEHVGEAPVNALDRVMSEACALSEGERSILILDQLQLAPFRQHLRLADFIRSLQWSYGDMTLKANPQNLLLFLISEEPLYHSLQQVSFNIWVDSGTEGTVEITPAALGLAENAREMLEALKAIFAALDVNPTLAEYRRVVHDIHVNIHDLEHLRTSIYGWVEGVNRQHLMSRQIEAVLERQMPPISRYLGIDPGAADGIIVRELDERDGPT